MDIIDSIDQAVGCHQCGGALDGSVSDDFCSEECQLAWSAARVGVGLASLHGYLTPSDLRYMISGVRGPIAAPLPHFTVDLRDGTITQNRPLDADSASRWFEDAIWRAYEEEAVAIRQRLAAHRADDVRRIHYDLHITDRLSMGARRFVWNLGA